MIKTAGPNSSRLVGDITTTTMESRTTTFHNSRTTFHSSNTFWEDLQQMTLPSGLFMMGTFIYSILMVVLVHGVIYGECQMLPRYDGLVPCL